jgi:hypothetical protein
MREIGDFGKWVFVRQHGIVWRRWAGWPWEYYCAERVFGLTAAGVWLGY